MDFISSCLRFHYYISQNRSVFWLEKDQWNLISKNFGTPIEINIENTPLVSITKNQNFIASLYKNDKYNQEIEIYRYDFKDSKPVNKDTYTVIDNFIESFGFDYIEFIVEQSSTSLNRNLVTNLNNHIYLVKNKPGKDHWLNIEECPEKINVIINEKFKGTIRNEDTLL
ncbi:MAG: hypothetical protein GF353_11995 [Candidatus Lokiarchaeota archaeon]|nr:hypothetical protein [Candidatus Lokiarchaeota archaeon]